MCGIAGRFAASPTTPGDLEPTARAFVGALKPRGPDDDGSWIAPDGSALLAHTRLAILDVGERGHQPMRSPDGRLTVVLNGEVYNHAALRAELAAGGARFRSTSDTEVVLAAYAAWGPGCVERFAGMFAFALHDAAPPTGAPVLTLARDRLGIKPLLVARRDGVLWFASTLTALLAAGAVRRTADRDALLEYFAWGSVRQPRTILTDATALPPGCRLEVRAGGDTLVPYWRLADAGRALASELAAASRTDVVRRVRTALDEATRLHLVSDVEVGAFLSGGVDSAAVVALMQRIGGRPVRTFTIGFSGGDQGDDERAAARATAAALGSVHEDAAVSDDEIAALHPALVEAIDQPSLDGANTWLASRLARRHVKVALSGLGGDELFAGYGHFKWFADPAPTASGPRALRTALALAQALRPNRFTQDALVRATDFVGRLTLLRRLLPDVALPRALAAGLAASAEARLRALAEREGEGEGDLLARATRAELGGYLRSTLLRDADAMSLAHGLELRPVLLHHPLVELACGLPAHHRWPPKRVFVDAVADLLPAEVLARPKRGFEMPLARWLAGPLRARVLGLLSGARARALFRPAYLASLRLRLGAGRPPRALWAWAMLLAWAERHDIEV